MDASVTFGPVHKSVPPDLWGRRAADVVASGVRLSDLQTPLLTLDRAASDRNVATLVTWAAEVGVRLAPHGKTTMSPELWQRLIDAGCWGITLATPWQVQVARAHGLRRILLANELADPVAIDWLTAELDADPDFEFACWVDSVAGVELLAGSRGERPIDVLVEVGAPGGRTGARGATAAREVVDAAAGSPRLRLRGVAGYEGSYPDDEVRGYLRTMVEVFEELEPRFTDPIITAGGSRYFDVVAEELGGVDATVIVRAGAFQAHDDVFYTGVSPFAGTSRAFRPALHAYARVVSRPEPGLVLLDAGKRDLPSDLDLPVVFGVPGAQVTSLADQHCFVTVPEDSTLAVGDVLRLGISHPCTAMQLWRLLPEIADGTAEDPVVVGFVETVF